MELRVHTLEGQLEDRDKQISKHKQTIAELQTQNKNLGDDLDRQQKEQLQEREQNKKLESNLRSEIQQLQQAQLQAEMVKKEQNGKIQGLTLTNNDTTAQLQRVTNELAAMREDRVRLEGEKKNNGKKIEDQEQSIRALEGTNASQKDKMDGLNRKLAELEAEIAAIQSKKHFC